MNGFIIASYTALTIAMFIIIGGVYHVQQEQNAQTAQLNEIIAHIDALNGSQNDILTFCNMGD